LIALVDADLVVYRVAATCDTDEEGALEIALLRCDKLMQDICYATDSDNYRAFLTGRNNFRKRINPEYKANRKDTVPPRYLQQCRDFLIQNWNAEVTEGCEADDALGMAQNNDTIICTLDKDLDMIPGLHYNWVRNEIYDINEVDALRNFYKQLLIGDRSDNIFGVAGIGKVKAARLIDPLEYEEDMYKVVRDLYNDDDRLCLNSECLWIWR
jgi:DNA polymerase-1